MSDLIYIDHRRTGRLTSELDAVQAHPNGYMAALSATGEQVWGPGEFVEDDEDGTLAKLAMVLLYDLVRRSLDRTTTTAHPFLEQVLSAASETPFAREPEAPRTTAGYPWFSEAMGSITAAAPLLIASCTMRETSKGDYEWGQVLHVVWRSPAPLDALADAIEGGSTADFAVLQWAP